MKIQWKEIVILIVTVMLVKMTVADPLMEENRQRQIRKGRQKIEQDRQLASTPDQSKTHHKQAP